MRATIERAAAQTGSILCFKTLNIMVYDIWLFYFNRSLALFEQNFHRVWCVVGGEGVGVCQATDARSRNSPSLGALRSNNITTTNQAAQDLHAAAARGRQTLPRNRARASAAPFEPSSTAKRPATTRYSATTPTHHTAASRSARRRLPRSLLKMKAQRHLKSHRLGLGAPRARTLARPSSRWSWPGALAKADSSQAGTGAKLGFTAHS